MISFIDLSLNIARTWMHIFVGLGVLLIVFMACLSLGRWYHGLLDQLDEARRKGKLPSLEPWKYQ